MPFYHSFKLLFSSGDGFLQFLYVLYSLWLRHVFLSGTQQRFAFCITSSSFCTTLWAISLCKERGKESMGSVVSVKTPAFPHSLRLHCKWFQNFTTYINIVNLFPVSYISYGYVFALNQKGKAIKWHEQFFSHPFFPNSNNDIKFLWNVTFIPEDLSEWINPFQTFGSFSKSTKALTSVTKKRQKTPQKCWNMFLESVFF